MPTIQIKHNPELTKADVFAAFEKHVSQDYKVMPSDVRVRDLFLVESGWSGAAVKLKQGKGKTSLYYCSNVPGKRERFIGMMTLGVPVMLGKKSRGPMEEVERIAREAPEFR